MRLAVVMPHEWRGGMLNFGMLLCNLLVNDPERAADLRVAFYVPKNYDRSGMAMLSSTVAVREFIQLPIKPSDPRFRHLLRGQKSIPAKHLDDDHTYIVTADGNPDLLEADALICLTGLFVHGPLLPIRPYVVYAPDFIQRVVPEIYGSVLESPWWAISSDQCVTMQSSGGVIVTSPRTGVDATSYAGVPRAKVRLLPMINAPLSDDTSPQECRGLQLNGNAHFLWVTNAAPHKNHVRAIMALQAYYDEHEGSLDCLMVGPETDLFAQDSSVIPSVDEFIGLRRRFEDFGGRLRILNEVSHHQYRSLVRRARFLWHPVLYDNGTFSVIEAARLGVRSLVAAYPQMRYICETFAINADEFDPWSIADMARALKRMETNTLDPLTIATIRNPPSLEREFTIGLKEMIRGACSSFDNSSGGGRAC